MEPPLRTSASAAALSSLRAGLESTALESTGLESRPLSASEESVSLSAGDSRGAVSALVLPPQAARVSSRPREERERIRRVMGLPVGLRALGQDAGSGSTSDKSL